MDPHILDGISRVGASIGSEKSCPDDDFVDRVNHTYTTNIIMFFTVVVLSRQMVGKPISCWIPNDFTGAQGEYAETVCWVTSTYFIAPNQSVVPIEKDIRYEKTIYYYQWVPFLLMIQAALFAVPCIIWRLFNNQSRINIRTVMEVSKEFKSFNDSCVQRQDLINCLVRHLEDALAIRHFRRHHRHNRTKPADQSAYGKGWAQLTNDRKDQNQFTTPVVPLAVSGQKRVPGPRPCNPASSSYLSGLYLIVKLLYLANSVVQLYCTGKYLRGSPFIFGIETLRDLMNTRFWDQTGLFPRVALCDFYLRRMGSNQNRYTIQCVLRINIFNEKIYIFLWFWFFVISFINLLNLLRWCYKLIFSAVRISFVRNLICIYVSIVGLNNPPVPSDKSLRNENVQEKHLTPFINYFKTQTERDASKVFVEDILGQDGVLLLYFVSMNVGPSVAANLAGVIWLKYQKTATTGVIDDALFKRAIGNPPIPPKRKYPPRPSLSMKDPTLTSFIPLNYLMTKTQMNQTVNDSDRSSESSRPTIENVERYRHRVRKRGSQFLDDRSSRRSSFIDNHYTDYNSGNGIGEINREVEEIDELTSIFPSEYN